MEQTSSREKVFHPVSSGNPIIHPTIKTHYKPAKIFRPFRALTLVVAPSPWACTLHVLHPWLIDYAPSGLEVVEPLQGSWSVNFIRIVGYHLRLLLLNPAGFPSPAKSGAMGNDRYYPR